ncbi:hypothetical protein Rsub_08544 [Raphidocelis subcapitata]|uniref:Uncharacterized protein n=1 Tax=Raphidocelis subcapitata TaxID=307507 RepID=A0A2V0PCD3_9CHLO|nr:hypothetical protein Rsub_08544 [Raphidocelis subcapitata]|eukprot:GBF95563.1 hypothetical protein Rsub_08544 [Raphidocelis subcapitata]
MARSSSMAAMASLLVVLALLAGCATASALPLPVGAAAPGRDLLASSSSVVPLQLPPISAFLPPTDALDFPTVDQFLAKVGLPSWEELGLPPISELMKPVGGPQGVQLPSLAEVATQANSTLAQVLADVTQDMVPASVQKFAKLSPIKLRTVIAAAVAVGRFTNAPALRLPFIPERLPTLTQLLRAAHVPGANATTTVLAQLNATNLAAVWDKPITVPALQLPAGLPSYEEALKAVTMAAKFLNALNALPEPGTLPSLVQVLKVVNAVHGASSG